MSGQTTMGAMTAAAPAAGAAVPGAFRRRLPGRSAGRGSGRASDVASYRRRARSGAAETTMPSCVMRVRAGRRATCSRTNIQERLCGSSVTT